MGRFEVGQSYDKSVYLVPRISSECHKGHEGQLRFEGKVDVLYCVEMGFFPSDLWYSPWFTCQIEMCLSCFIELGEEFSHNYLLFVCYLFQFIHVFLFDGEFMYHCLSTVIVKELIVSISLGQFCLENNNCYIVWNYY